MLDVRRLRLLLAVGRHGSIAAAAEALAFTPSAVSQQLATLEREVGVALLERGPRSVRLTEAGRLLAAEAETVLARLGAVEAEVHALAGLQGGRLGVGSFATAGATIMAPALAAFSARHAEVELAFVEGDPEDCLPRLRFGDLDLVLTYEYDLVPLAADAGLRRVPLTEDPFRVVLPEGHRAAAAEAVALEDLRDEAWIAEPRADCRHFTVRACAAAGFAITPRFLSSDYALSLALVRAGVAVALIPALALPSVPSGLAVRPLAGRRLVRRIDATHRVGGERVPAVTAMLDAIRAVAGAHEADGPTRLNPYRAR